MSEELIKRIGDAYLNPTFVDGQVLLHTQLNEIVSVTKEGINENYYDIQRLIKGEYSVGNSEKLNGALLSRYLDTTLKEDDNLVPSSQQVKAYIDKAIEDVQLGSDVGNIMLELNSLKTKVSANEGSIGNLQTSVDVNTTDIDNLEASVANIETDIKDLKESSVIDSLESNSTTNAPSIRAVNEALKEVYSTEETVIGTWIDGKPLYRKVFVITDESYFISSSYYDISDLNVEQIFFEKRVLNYTNSIGQRYTRAQDEMVSSNDYSRCFFRNDEIQLRLGETEVNAISDGSNASWIIVINYTKTTD